MTITINKKSIRYVINIIFIGVVVLLSFVVFKFNGQSTTNTIPTVSAENCLPAFRDGGGPFYLPNAPFRENIAAVVNDGEMLLVEGYIFDSICQNVVANAVLDIWQASEEGEYEDEYYRGQVMTDSNGYYKFETVVPLGYGEGTAYRPPHIHFKVHVDGKEIVTSQMFFEDVRGREGFNDEYIINLEQTSNGWIGNHNIILPDFVK